MYMYIFMYMYLYTCYTRGKNNANATVQNTCLLFARKSLTTDDGGFPSCQKHAADTDERTVSSNQKCSSKCLDLKVENEVQITTAGVSLISKATSRPSPVCCAVNQSHSSRPVPWPVSLTLSLTPSLTLSLLCLLLVAEHQVCLPVIFPSFLDRDASLALWLLRLLSGFFFLFCVLWDPRVPLSLCSCLACVLCRTGD